MIFLKLQVRKHNRKKAIVAHGAMIAVVSSCAAVVGFSVADVTGCSEVLVTFGLSVEVVLVMEWVVVLGLVTGWVWVVIFEAGFVVISACWVVLTLAGVVSALTVVTVVCTWPGPRTALLLRTEITILMAGKFSPLFHEVAVT